MKSIGIKGLIGGILLAAGLVSAASATEDTLDEVRKRGALRCGVDGAVLGLSYVDSSGSWSGIDVDFCRAVAAGVLGDASKVDFVALKASQRLDALATGRIDILSRNTTWTLSRDVGHGLSFAGILYHDGQGFMVSRDAPRLSALDLGGSRICVIAETRGPDNIQRYFTRHRMAYELSPFNTFEAATSAYLKGSCDALSLDRSQLHALRAKLDDPRTHRILPEVISKEPLGPAVRKTDPRWFDIVRWTLFILINAEELGVDSHTVHRAAATASLAETRALLDLDDQSAAALGLEPGWSRRIIEQVGNYHELFARNLGAESPLGIKRGLNALWRDGGLLYAPPAR